LGCEMLKFKIEKISQNQAIVSFEALKSLLNMAKKVDEIEVEEIVNDLPIEGLMMLSESSNSLDFLKDEREDIYSIDDLKVRYK